MRETGQLLNMNIVQCSTATAIGRVSGATAVVSAIGAVTHDWLPAQPRDRSER